MRLGKAAIKKSFSAAATTYDANSEFQFEVAKALTKRIRGLYAGAPPARILDVGCGTGHLAVELRREFPASKILACDISTLMLCESSLKTGKEGLVAGDSEALPFAASAFDVVAANLALQWSCDVALSFAEAARVLKSGGILAFSTLGPATLSELRRVYPRKDRLPEFPGVDAINAALCAAELEVLDVETERAVKDYSDLFALLRVLRKIGASPKLPAAEKTLGSASALREAAARYKSLYPSDHGIVATYELIFVSARKRP